MSFNPETQMLVDQLNGLLAKVGTEWDDAAQIRQMTTAEAPPLEERFPVPVVEDRTVPARDGHQLPVRVYAPEGDGLPGVVFFHGGGWAMGDLEGHDDICRRLAVGVGCVVVSVDYRLAPEHPFPRPLHDAVDATVWVSENAESLRIDPDRLAVAGDSAGGNLAAAAAIAIRDRGGPDLAMQLLIYPVLDDRMSSASYRENAEGYVLSSRVMAWYWDQYAPGSVREDPLAAPLRLEDLSGLPPAHIVTADLDPLRDEGRQYAERLRECGVPVTAENYRDAFHGFFGFGAIMPVARSAFDSTVQQLREQLSNELDPERS